MITGTTNTIFTSTVEIGLLCGTLRSIMMTGAKLFGSLDRQERMARWAILRWKLECDTDALDNALPNIPFIEEHSDFFKEQRRGEQAAGIDEHDEEDLHYPEGDDHEEDQTPEISDDLDGYDFPEDFYTDEE